MSILVNCYTHGMFQQWSLETDMKGINFVQTKNVQDNYCPRLFGKNNYEYFDEVLCAPKKTWEIGKNVRFKFSF